jgi:DNA-binding transcriptional LysR family regulator
MRLDISDLRLFVNVVEAGSLTQGAARSHRALASVSARIKEMELSVGAPLLIRERLGVKVTDAGRALLHHSYVVLRDVQQMNDDLSEYAKRITGYVKICSNSSALIEFLPAPLSGFLSMYPAVNVNIEEMVNHEIVGAVIEGRADIGIASEPVDKRTLDTIPLHTARYAIVVPSTDPLAFEKKVFFADLLDHEFVGLGRGTWLQIMLEEYARSIGKTLLQRVQVRNFDVICDLVARGVGIGIVPEPVARRLERQLQFCTISLEDDWAQLEFIICMRQRSELPPHSARLVDFLVKHQSESILQSQLLIPGAVNDNHEGRVWTTRLGSPGR